MSPTTVIALEEATLTCLASVDDATYSWHRVKDRIPSRSIGQDNSTLTIPAVTPNDAGVYYCKAKKEGDYLWNPIKLYLLLTVKN